MKFLQRLLLPVVMLAMTVNAYGYVIDLCRIGGLNYTVDLDTKTATVTSGSGSEKYSGDIVIPETIDLTEYDSSFSGVVCTVNVIGANAFSGCTELTSIKIPNTVATIGLAAFSGCELLSSVDIPSSVTYIGESAFSGCDGLTSINIPGSVTTIDDRAFYGCSGLTSIDIPNSVQSIGAAAFLGCKNLTSIKIPNTITYIQRSTFDGCVSLSDIEIPTSVEVIGDDAFRDCVGLTSVMIPSSVMSIGDNVFYGCINLTAINVDAGNMTYASDNGLLLSKDLLTLVAVPSGLKKFTFPETVTSLDEDALRGVGPNIEELIIPDKVKLDPDFKPGYPKLRNLRLPDSFVLKECLFAKDTVRKEYENEMFHYTYTDYNVVVLLPALEELSIAGVKNNIGYYFPHDKPTVKYGSSRYPSERRYDAVGDKSFVQNGVTYYVNNSLKKIIIRDEDIVDYELQNTNFLEVELEKPIKSYGKDAFLNSGIVDVTISDDMDELEAECFAGCSKMQSLTSRIAGAGSVSGASNFGELFGSTAVSGMRAVTQELENGDRKTYYLPASLHKLVLSEGCEMIPYGGLYNCNMLDTLVLPTTLYMVGDKALYGCARLKDIFCKGADPAVAYDGTFEGVRVSSCKLHVPYNTSDIYKRSTGWEDFYYIEEEAPLKISVNKSIENAGVIYGIDEYQPGQTASLRAVANYGYRFEGWMENGALLTDEADYSFTVTDSRELTAVFVPVNGENDISVQPQSTSVTFAFAVVPDATSYRVDVYSNVEMTSLCASVTVDAVQPQVRAVATQTVVVDGLSPESEYYYKVTALTSTSGNDVVLSQFTGAFLTTSPTGIDDVRRESSITEVGRYDTAGRKLASPIKGLNIIRMSDGSVRKVMVK